MPASRVATTERPTHPRYASTYDSSPATMTGPIPDGQKMFLTTRDVATRWSISERQVREMAQAGEIPAMKLGKLWRFPADRLERFERAAVAA